MKKFLNEENKELIHLVEYLIERAELKIVTPKLVFEDDMRQINII